MSLLGYVGAALKGAAQGGMNYNEGVKEDLRAEAERKFRERMQSEQNAAYDARLDKQLQDSRDARAEASMQQGIDREMEQGRWDKQHQLQKDELASLDEYRQNSLKQPTGKSNDQYYKLLNEYEDQLSSIDKGVIEGNLTEDAANKMKANLAVRFRGYGLDIEAPAMKSLPRPDELGGAEAETSKPKMDSATKDALDSEIDAGRLNGLLSSVGSATGREGRATANRATNALRDTIDSLDLETGGGRGNQTTRIPEDFVARVESLQRAVGNLTESQISEINEKIMAAKRVDPNLPVDVLRK